jgi:hypothetical protein
VRSEHLGCRYCVGTPPYFKKINKELVIAVNIFHLDYAVLPVAFFIVTDNVLKARDGNNRTSK